MSVITDIFRLLVFSNFWISIGAVAYSMVTVLQLDLDVPVEFYWFVGCCTLCSYSLQRFIQFSYLKKQSARQKWLGGNRLYVGGAVLFSGLGGVILGLTVLTAFQILCFVPVALISLFYSTRVLGKTSASKTKEKKSLLHLHRRAPRGGARRSCRWCPRPPRLGLGLGFGLALGLRLGLG